MKKKSKKVIKWGRNVTEQLYKATVAYIEKNGGSSVVVGGIAIVDEGKPHSYGIMVRVLGKKPIYKN